MRVFFPGLFGSKRWRSPTRLHGPADLTSAPHPHSQPTDQIGRRHTSSRIPPWPEAHTPPPPTSSLAWASRLRTHSSQGAERAAVAAQPEILAPAGPAVYVRRGNYVILSHSPHLEHDVTLLQCLGTGDWARRKGLPSLRLPREDVVAEQPPHPRHDTALKANRSTAPPGAMLCRYRHARHPHSKGCSFSLGTKRCFFRAPFP